MDFTPAFLANLSAPSISSMQSVNRSCADPTLSRSPLVVDTFATLSCPLLLKTSTAVLPSTNSSAIFNLLNIELPRPCTHTTHRFGRLDPNHRPFSTYFFGVTISTTWHACILDFCLLPFVFCLAFMSRAASSGDTFFAQRTSHQFRCPSRRASARQPFLRSRRKRYDPPVSRTVLAAQATPPRAPASQSSCP